MSTIRERVEEEAQELSGNSPGVMLRGADLAMRLIVEELRSQAAFNAGLVGTEESADWLEARWKEKGKNEEV